MREEERKKAEPVTPVTPCTEVSRDSVVFRMSENNLSCWNTCLGCGQYMDYLFGVPLVKGYTNYMSELFLMEAFVQVPIVDMPVDPNEPTYCLCQQVSYGEMIG